MLAVLLVALPVGAQTTRRRRVGPAPQANDQPELEDEDQEGELGSPDQPDDDPSEERRALPGTPRGGSPRLPSSPEEDDEQPSAPPEHGPPAAGPAEPASAIQPVSPE